jgi:hypothetical protein
MSKTLISDPYFDTQRCVDRLYQWYKQHNTLIVAFDYDDTLYDFHKVGFKYTKIVKILKECEILGFTLIIFTAHTTEKECEDIKKIVNKKFKLHVKYVNCSPVMPTTKKPYFNLLLDDKAGLGQTYNILSQVIIKIWKKSF